MDKKIKFRARYSTYDPYIEKVYVDRETDKSVWINGRCFRKDTGGTQYYETRYFDTFREAFDFIDTRLKNKYSYEEEALRSFKQVVEAFQNTTESNIREVKS